MKVRNEARIRHTVTQALRRWQSEMATVPAFLQDNTHGIDLDEIDEVIDRLATHRIHFRHRATREQS